MGNGSGKVSKEIKKAKKSNILKYERKNLTDIPDSITDLSNLTNLSLAFNQLKTIPDSFQSLTSLKQLDLSHNQLSEFPDAIIALTQLERLVLNHNGIPSVPDLVTQLVKLKEFHITNNQLTSLPQDIVNIVQVNNIDVTCNWILAENLDEDFLPIVGGAPIVGYFDQYVPDKIIDGIYLGSARCIENVTAMEELEKRKISHVLSIGKEIVMNLDKYPEKLKNDFNHKTYDIADSPHEDIVTIFREIKSFMDTAREEGGCLVHCVAGISRSASVVIAYIMQLENMTYDQAEKFVRSKRPCVKPNDGFETQLKDLEKELLKEQ
jgi:Leucine-rich repeat (LRR) protein